MIKYESSSSNATTAVSPPTCTDDCLRMAANSVSCCCRSVRILASIFLIIPCNWQFSFLFLTERLSVYWLNLSLCSFWRAITSLFSVLSMEVVTVGFASSFFPDSPKKPVRFLFGGSSCELLRAITGTRRAILSFISSCSLSTSMILFSRFSFSASSRQTLSIRSLR